MVRQRDSPYYIALDCSLRPSDLGPTRRGQTPHWYQHLPPHAGPWQPPPYVGYLPCLAFPIFFPYPARPDLAAQLVTQGHQHCPTCGAGLAIASQLQPPLAPVQNNPWPYPWMPHSE